MTPDDIRSQPCPFRLIRPMPRALRPSTRAMTRRLIGSLFCVALAVGCGPRETRMNIVAFPDGQTIQNFSERFDTGAFNIDAHKNIILAFHLEDSDPGPPTCAPADAGPTPPISQTVIIEVFWQPRPGVTYVESTQTNATFSYCLQRGPDAIRYGGAGFVYLTKLTDDRVEGRIESSSLTPAGQTGSPRDLFGRCRLTGTFQANHHPRQTVDAALRLKRLFAAPVPATGGQP